MTDIADDRARGPIGMLYPATAATRSVYGGPVAVREFVRALLTYTEPERLRLFAEPAALAEARRDLAAVLEPQRAARLTVGSSVGLPQSVAGAGFGVWHTPGIGGSSHAFDLRDTLARRPYPITLTHHTISYHALLHEFFLPLVLNGVRPYDSLICTSTAARAAVENLLEGVSASLEAHHGVPIRYRGRLDLIPLGVDTEAFRPRDKAAARVTLAIPQDAYVVLYLGRLSTVDKADLSPLLVAFRRLLRRNPTRPSLLALAGASSSGSYERLLAEKIAGLGLTEHVRIQRPEVQHPWLAAADVFVAPSDSVQESFGLAVAEALAAGVPQVVSDWSGYRDIVAPGETGFLIPTKWMRCDDHAVTQSLATPRPELPHAILAQSVAVDVGALESALQVLLDAPDLRARMAEQSRRRALSTFSWARVVSEYHALWDELSAVAGRDRDSRPRELPYAVPQYYDRFAHFASEQHRRDSTLHLTADGRDAAADRDRPRFADDPPLMMSGRVHEAVLDVLADADGAATACQVGGLTDAIAERLACTESAVRRHVMWLVKHGLVDLRRPVDPTAGPS